MPRYDCDRLLGERADSYIQRNKKSSIGLHGRFCNGAFDIRTGEVLAPPCMVPVKTYRTVVEGDENLRELGRRMLWEGAQDIRFEEV